MKVVCIVVGIVLFLSQLALAQEIPISSQSGIKGRVVDLLGRPLKEVKVRVRGSSSFETQTDTNGEYKLASLPSGVVEFSASAIGFRRYETKLYVNPNEEQIFDIGLEAGQLADGPNLIVKGYVRNSARKNLADVTVVARNVFNSDVAVFARTSKEGSFNLRLPSYGQYLIYVLLRGKKSIVHSLFVDTEKIYVANFLL